MTGSQINGIFISYRRDDSAGHAGRLFDRLMARFGKGAVFMDVEGIEAGVDFVETIEEAVGGCDVLLAVIGRGWLDSRDSEGKRRLDDDQDFIRLETSSALARNVRVIPVLVEGAKMPRAADLPEDLKPITRRQAVELRDSRWEDDIQALVDVLERMATQAQPVPVQEAEGQGDRRDTRAWAWKSGVAALFGAALIAGTVTWWPAEREATPAASPAAEAQPAIALNPEPTRPTEPPKPQPTATPAAPVPAAPKPAAPSPAAVKPVVAPPQTSVQVAVAQPVPAPVPVPPAAPVTPPQPALAAVAPAPVALRKIAIIAVGEPTFRGFWEGERRATLSAKIVGTYREALRESASGRVELSISTDSERDLRKLDQALREPSALCDSLRSEAVFVARLEEPQSFSRAESAFWPELQLTAITCSSGKQTRARANLSPMREDRYPFERNLAETMEKFARENRHLLQ
jgi:outer membrane biosynthesis protein TonB